ncbi:hypothetical protein HS041_19555 [Planomonospora sp. ID67723]|uniref:DUF6766 family protein n=1 Tax=Planomonospora sp. ID67723 TaxID=2738134 RepID=UPI0018C39CFA|nr:DUF6766 family protein [Planomonospora sp. ID67723]MBG0829968.1 hypothetical protein [Planomonospora sp. ID67723]
MRRFAKDNALSLFFLLLFALALAGQSVAGNAAYNERQRAEGGAAVSWPEYVTSSEFAVDVAENWQSEYLQFLLFIMATVWWVQRGSPESKKPGDEGPESDEQQKVGRHADPDSPAWAKATGLRQTLYGNSLGTVMGLVFLLSWLAQSVAGQASRNSERLARLQDPVSWGEYVTSADFWNRTLQNWQSEFLAVLSMVVLSIYLRQRGSPESKPVGTPHGATDVEG